MSLPLHLHRPLDCQPPIRPLHPHVPTASGIGRPAHTHRHPLVDVQRRVVSVRDAPHLADRCTAAAASTTTTAVEQTAIVTAAVASALLSQYTQHEREREGPVDEQAAVAVGAARVPR